ncbi:MAG: CDP-alcohol phosphatidyltransferase family protein [Planctomycetota bacterium]|nr:MAG: CDP-alcohol phosphatidyltransferase family protein [Planctomycetota bacterium]
MNLKQIPNLITFSRLLFAMAAFWVLEQMRFAPADGQVSLAPWAFWFYAAASLTDFLDGYIARKYGWVTSLGRVADPVVDKVLTLGAMAYLAAGSFFHQEGDWMRQVMPVWGVVLLLAREFLVTALRGLVESRGEQFPADGFGKAKMALQTTYILVILGAFGRVPDQLGLSFLYFLRDPWAQALLFWLVIGLTLISGANYCLRGAKILSKVEW